MSMFDFDDARFRPHLDCGGLPSAPSGLPEGLPRASPPNGLTPTSLHSVAPSPCLPIVPRGSCSTYYGNHGIWNYDEAAVPDVNTNFEADLISFPSVKYFSGTNASFAPPPYVTLQDLELDSITYGHFVDPYTHGTSGASLELPREGPKYSDQVKDTLSAFHRSNAGAHRHHVEGGGQWHNSSRNAALKQWLLAHASNPYPNAEEIQAFATTEKKTVRQIRVVLRNLRQRMNLDSTDDPTEETSPPSASGDLPSVKQHLAPTGPEHLSLRSVGHLYINPPPLTLGHSLPTRSDLSSSSPPSAKDIPHGQPIPEKRKGRRRHASRYQPSFNTSNDHNSPHKINNATDRHVKRLFHCTVCPKSFKSSFDWKRHEKTVHWFTDTHWVCLLHSTTFQGTFCTICHHRIYDAQHLSRHGIHLCAVDHIFSSKDLLTQHVQQVHLKRVDENMRKHFSVLDSWAQSVDVKGINPDALYCGFCFEMFGSATERMDHVKRHFLDGMSMELWIPRVTV